MISSGSLGISLLSESLLCDNSVSEGIEAKSMGIRPHALLRASLLICIILPSRDTIDELQCGVRSELNEAVRAKWKLKRKSLLSSFRNLVFSHKLSREIVQARWIARDRSGVTGLGIRWKFRLFTSCPANAQTRCVVTNIVVACTDYTPCVSQASPLQIHPFSTPSKSTPMNRQFPPEIIQLIVEASFPSEVITSTANGIYTVQIFARYSILNRYSVLNSTWNGVCEAALYSNVVLKSDLLVSTFVQSAGRNGGAVGKMVSTMTIACDGWRNRRAVAVLKCVPQLRRLTIGYASFHAQDLADMHRLDELTLILCTFAIPPPSTQLSIHSLFLYSYGPSKAISALLSTTILPKLKQLDVEVWAPAPIDFSWILPQLSALQIRVGYSRADIRHLSDDQSLRLLSYESTQLGIHPPSLTTLPPFMMVYIRNHHELMQSLSHFFTKSAGLKTLFARCKHVEVVGSDKETETELLVTKLRSKGIVVEIRTGTFSFSDAIRRMDAILLAEKAAAEEYSRVYGE